MSSLAGYLRERAQKGFFNFEDIVRKYENWVLNNRYMVLCHMREKWLEDGIEFEYLAVKCAKRRNDVYMSRVENRLYGLGRHVPEMAHDFFKYHYTKMLFVTLSYDVKRCRFSEAWQNIGNEWNLYRANLRKKYGKFSVFRTGKSYENGYPHIHGHSHF